MYLEPDPLCKVKDGINRHTDFAGGEVTWSLGRRVLQVLGDLANF